MYKKLAQIISNKFIQKGLIDEAKKDIYIYGLEYIVSNIVYLAIFFALCLLTKTLLPSLCFWLGIFLLRKIAGGHHAKTYLSCHFLFAFNHILFIFIQYIFPQQYYQNFIVASLLITIVSIFTCAPVDHKNKPFIKTEYHRYKILSHIYGSILLVLWILIVFQIIPSNQYIFSFTFGTISATISLLCAKIIRTKERSLENENLKEAL